MYTSLMIRVLLSLVPLFAGGESTLVHEGVSLHYRTRGVGSPVVLLHGFADTGAAFERNGYVERLARKHFVIVPDLRGHGASGKPRGDGAYGRRMSEDVLALLDHLGHGRAHVVGFSLGGSIAVDLAVRAPERIASVAVIGFGWPEREAYGVWTRAIAWDLENGRGLLEMLLEEDASPEEITRAQGIHRLLVSRNDTAALAGVARGMVELVPERANLEIRVLVVVGELDRFLGDVERLEKAWPQAEVHVHENCDHIGSLRSARTLALVAEFIGG